MINTGWQFSYWSLSWERLCPYYILDSVLLGWHHLPQLLPHLDDICNFNRWTDNFKFKWAQYIFSTTHNCTYIVAEIMVQNVFTRTVSFNLNTSHFNYNHSSKVSPLFLLLSLFSVNCVSGLHTYELSLFFVKFGWCVWMYMIFSSLFPSRLCVIFI